MKGAIEMTTATLEREELVQIVRNLPDEKVRAVLGFVKDINKEGHIPNAETIRILRESEAGLNLAGPFKSVEELMTSLLSDDDA